MTKADLINNIAVITGNTKVATEAFVEAFIENIRDNVLAGEKISIKNFGTFELVERAEKNGVNPKTKEKIVIPASMCPKFKPAQAFKDAANEK